MFLRRTGLLPSPVVRLTPPVNDVPMPVVLTSDWLLVGDANRFLDKDAGFLYEFYVSIVCLRACLAVPIVANGVSTFSNTRPDRYPIPNYFPLIFYVRLRFVPLTNAVL